MLAALATLAFLATLWLIAVAAVHTLSESGSKMIAALKGRSPIASEPVAAPVAVRFSQRAPARPALRAQPQWRAAA